MLMYGRQRRSGSSSSAGNTIWHIYARACISPSWPPSPAVVTQLFLAASPDPHGLRVETPAAHKGGIRPAAGAVHKLDGQTAAAAAAAAAAAVTLRRWRRQRCHPGRRATLLSVLLWNWRVLLVICCRGIWGHGKVARLATLRTGRQRRRAPSGGGGGCDADNRRALWQAELRWIDPALKLWEPTHTQPGNGERAESCCESCQGLC